VTPGKSGRVARTRAVGRREESSGTAAFAGGEGAPVVVVECDEVLQLGGARGEAIARNSKDWRLGEELTEKWRTVAALGWNPSEGGASDGRRRWTGRGERWGKVWCSRGEVWRGVGNGGADGHSGTF
jgi:hypothetical protein